MGGVEDEVLVDLVGEHEQVVLDADRGQLGEDVTSEHGTGGIVRRVDDEQRRVGRDRRAHGVDIDGPGGTIGGQRDGHATGAGQGDGRGVGVVVGLEDDDLRTRLHLAEDRRGDRLGGADGDEHLGVRVVTDPVVARALGGDGLPQHGQAAAGAVLVVAGTDLLARDLEHAGRAVGIREALAEVDGVELGGAGGHGGEDGLTELAETTDGTAHGVTSLVATRYRTSRLNLVALTSSRRLRALSRRDH